MPGATLLDFFRDHSSHPAEFLVHDDGYRTRTFRYDEIAAAAHAVAGRLRSAGIRKGEKVLVWSENRPEWIVAFWGCLLEGVIVVPIDYRASADYLRRVNRIVQARGIFVGDEVELGTALDGTVVWTMRELERLERAKRAGGRAGTVDRRPPGAGPPAVTRDDVAEIIFTSGATAEPKGVVITHRNILANLEPVEREIQKYRKYGRPFRPIRFLNLLPLSHMFGQAMAAFIPPLLPGLVVFMRGHNPNDIARLIKRRRVSVLVCVPKILDVLRELIVRRFPETAGPLPSGLHVVKRWWRYRRVHRFFGFKFWCFVVGAAPLERSLEEFWSALGFLVVQGYGLTETAPIVTLNHPFETRKGTVGKPIAGVEVRIAPDGEILVRGENVSSGYVGAGAEAAEAFEDGWFHTGDIGELDEAGRLTVLGRKKEMIVTPEGLNVFPEDVERALNAVPGVRDSAVVGVRSGGEERVHAVLVLDEGVQPQEIVRQANQTLADHQRIRGASIWPGDELPRTEATRKLKRREVQQWVATGGVARAAPSAGVHRDRLAEVIGRFSGPAPLGQDTTLTDLGLSSLERVELMMALEERFQTTIDEAAFTKARSLGELRALMETPGPAAGPAEPLEFPAWNRRGPARLVRRLSLPTWLLPLARLFARLRVEGLGHLDGLEGPVIFAANHQSHMDTPAILAALPAAWRYRLAPAMAKEFFRGHFLPAQHTLPQRLTSSLNYYLAALFFNAFPLPQREAGARETLRYIGELVGEGLSILIFPEGKRTERGEIIGFQPGVGMMASRLRIPVVPVRLDGLERVLHQSWKMARPGRVRVAFGAPLELGGDDYAVLAQQVEAAVRAL